MEDIQTLSNDENDCYYKPVETKSVFHDNCIDLEGLANRYINLSLEEYWEGIHSHIGKFINTFKDSFDLSDTFI